MDFGSLLVPMALVVGAAVYFSRHHDTAARARFLRRAGAIWMAVFTAFAALFIAGETFSDPGGWKAAGLVALWAIPLAALSAMAWWWPDGAARVLAGLAAVAVAVSVWFAVNPDGWRAFEDHNGPVRAVGSFVLAAAMGVLGVKRTGPAGLLLIALGVVPVAVASLGGRGVVSLAVVSTPAVIVGALYLASATMARRQLPADPAWPAPGRRDQPRAA